MQWYIVNVFLIHADIVSDQCPILYTQISMNVLRALRAVLRTVQTLLDHTHVTVAVAIILIMMDTPAMVLASIILGCKELCSICSC